MDQASDKDYGGFQSFVGEKKAFEVYEGEYVSTVVNTYMAGRILEVASQKGFSMDPKAANSLSGKVNVEAALTFLANSQNADGVYALYPGGKVSGILVSQ